MKVKAAAAVGLLRLRWRCAQGLSRRSGKRLLTLLLVRPALQTPDLKQCFDFLNEKSVVAADPTAHGVIVAHNQWPAGQVQRRMHEHLHT